MAADRILVVDDEESIREIVSSMLATAGYKCHQAGSGNEALALLESGEKFELMLSDLMMANLDGIGLLERTKERFPDMPVVMVTAVHDISVALAPFETVPTTIYSSHLNVNSCWQPYAGRWKIAG